MSFKFFGKLIKIGVYALLINSLTTEFQPVVAKDSSLRETRETFKKALKAQGRGYYKQAKKLISEYPKHPLHGYVTYYDLRRRIGRHPSAEVKSFLEKESDSRVGQKLKKSWLIRLHKRRQWKEFIAFYQKLPNSDVEMKCRNFEAKIMIGNGASVLKEIKSTWLSAKSLPKECDPAFSFLYSDNNLNDELVWARIRMAYTKNNTSLAKYLSRYLKERRLSNLQGSWTLAKRSPHRLLKRQKFSDSPETRDILVYAITRLSKSNFDGAINAWGKITRDFSFSPKEKSLVMSAFGSAGARKQDPRALKFLDLVDEIHVSRADELHRLSLGIFLKAWPELVKWTGKDPRSDISKSRWQYWRAFALKELGHKTESRALLTKIAKRRDYHGFLAADMLGTDYQFNDKPILVTTEEMDSALKTSNFSRANELFQIGRQLEAKREFFHELGNSSERQLEIAAKLAELWNWPKGSIFALGRASSYNDLTLRFPVQFTKEIKDELAPKSKYIVRKGDSLWKISSKFGITVTQLRKWNSLKKRAILHPGQRLIVKNRTLSKTATDPARYYKVRKGDSLWKISKKFNVSIKDIKTWNDMGSGRFLRIGRTLQIGHKQIKRFSLSLPRVLAIIRAESAFDPYARSVANARGLMQVIPSTARLTARKHGIRLRRIRDLYHPKKSIAIGTAYLGSLLNDFNGNFAIAAAAYNAGPHRAKRWQKKRCGDPRMWIDSIPITETRRYVRRAIFYSRIYEWRLGLPIKKIDEEIGIIPGRKSKTKSKDCWL